MKQERYLRAYYHTFTSTGNDAIDAILEAIARAGKAYHSTGEWDNDASEGATFWEAIQRAADSAARRAPDAAREKRMREVAEEIKRVRDFLATRPGMQPIAWLDQLAAKLLEGLGAE